MSIVSGGIKIYGDQCFTDALAKLELGPGFPLKVLRVSERKRGENVEISVSFLRADDGALLWDHPLEVMRTLCRECHWERTLLDRSMRKTTSDMSRDDLEQAIASVDRRRNLIDVTGPWDKVASDFLEELDAEKARLLDLFKRFDAWEVSNA